MTDSRKLTVRAGYDRMADRYARWSASIDDEPRRRVVDAFATQLADDARVLDLGCGAGMPTTHDLARRFRVVGVDASPVQLESARCNVPGAEFILGDFTSLDFPAGSFDGVAALYSVSHVPREEHPGLFADVHRWLVPGGLFVANLGAEDSPDWLGEWLGEQMFFSSHAADENRHLLRTAGFELELDEVAVTHEPEGDVRFLWVIARKPEAA